MSTISVAKARAEALFVTDVQPSESRNDEQVRYAVQNAIRQYGSRGCAARVAAEFGDHPETAVDRMRWAIERVRDIYPQRHRYGRAFLRSSSDQDATLGHGRLNNAA
jgi:hypothetical protein